MKHHFIVFCFTAVIVALLVSCGPAANVQGSISISCDDFQKQANVTRDAQVAVGQTVTVSLCSNRTTGFSWPEKAKIGNPQVVEQAAYKWVPPVDTGKVGVAGSEVYTFRAVQPGASSIDLGYSKPWEGGEKDVYTFKLNLTVK